MTPLVIAGEKVGGIGIGATKVGGLVIGGEVAIRGGVTPIPVPTVPFAASRAASKDITLPRLGSTTSSYSGLTSNDTNFWVVIDAGAGAPAGDYIAPAFVTATRAAITSRNIKFTSSLLRFGAATNDNVWFFDSDMQNYAYSATNGGRASSKDFTIDDPGSSLAVCGCTDGTTVWYGLDNDRILAFDIASGEDDVRRRLSLPNIHAPELVDMTTSSRTLWALVLSTSFGDRENLYGWMALAWDRSTLQRDTEKDVLIGRNSRSGFPAGIWTGITVSHDSLFALHHPTRKIQVWDLVGV